MSITANTQNLDTMDLCGFTVFSKFLTCKPQTVRHSCKHMVIGHSVHANVKIHKWQGEQ